MKKPVSVFIPPKHSSKVVRSYLNPGEFCTTRGLMNLLKIKYRQTIYNLVNEGLPRIIVGRNFRFLKHEVINFLRRCSQQRIKIYGQGNFVRQVGF